MGTPAYMSPEQTSGLPLDHRSDIFSLGVMLHEMSTGKRPFNGASAAELASAILRDTPPLVTALRPDLPSELARLQVRRCLEKDRSHRIQTARDVSNEPRELLARILILRLQPFLLLRRPQLRPARGPFAPRRASGSPSCPSKVPAAMRI